MPNTDKEPRTDNISRHEDKLIYPLVFCFFVLNFILFLNFT